MPPVTVSALHRRDAMTRHAVPGRLSTTARIPRGLPTGSRRPHAVPASFTGSRFAGGMAGRLDPMLAGELAHIGCGERRPAGHVGRPLPVLQGLDNRGDEIVAGLLVCRLGAPVAACCLTDHLLMLAHGNRVPKHCCGHLATAIPCCVTEERNTGATMTDHEKPASCLRCGRRLTAPAGIAAVVAPAARTSRRRRRLPT